MSMRCGRHARGNNHGFPKSYESHISEFRCGSQSPSVYNGDGLRMSHTVSGQTTSYTWDAAAELPVVLQDGTNTYVYGLDLISATNSSGVQTYVLHDSLGSTTDLLDGTGNGVATYGYDIFGAIRSQTGSSPNQWLFAGEQRDSDSSLYFLRARYYDPAIGRFLSQDPAQAGHPYAYANNNPVNFVDPYGLDACDVAGTLLGAEDQCRWLGDQAESGASTAGDAIVSGANAAADGASWVGEQASEGAKYAANAVAGAAGEAWGFAKRFFTLDCLSFVAGLGGMAVAGPGGSLAVMTAVYALGLGLQVAQGDRTGFQVEATLSGAHWGSKWLEDSLRGRGVLWESQKSRGGMYKMGANFGLSETLAPMERYLGTAGLLYSAGSCVASGL